MKFLDRADWRNRRNKTSGDLTPKSIFMLMALMGFRVGFAGEAVTGKILIDGVEYGGNHKPSVVDTNHWSEENRHVEEFHALLVAGSMNVEYRQSPTYQVTISGDRSVIPLISTESKHGTLIISPKQGSLIQSPVAITLSSPYLRKVVHEGAGDMLIDKVSVDDLELAVNGSGNITLSGRVQKFIISNSGASDVDARKLQADYANVSILGSGDVNLTVNSELTAMIAGSGDINYWGKPEKISKSVDGSGEIEAGE